MFMAQMQLLVPQPREPLEPRQAPQAHVPNLPNLPKHDVGTQTVDECFTDAHVAPPSPPALPAAASPPPLPCSVPDSADPPDVPDTDKVVYVLRLRDDKWYVGTTQRERLTSRVEEHRTKLGGARWTAIHDFVELVDVLPLRTIWDEDNKVKAMMQQWGIDNVRGGTYSKPKLSADAIKFLTHELRHNHGLCIRCGKEGHMMKQCTNQGTAAADDRFF